MFSPIWVISIAFAVALDGHRLPKLSRFQSISDLVWVWLIVWLAPFVIFLLHLLALITFFLFVVSVCTHANPDVTAGVYSTEEVAAGAKCIDRELLSGGI